MCSFTLRILKTHLTQMQYLQTFMTKMYASNSGETVSLIMCEKLNIYISNSSTQALLLNKLKLVKTYI